MQGRRPPSFLPTKKKPAGAGWSDKTLGQLLLMYASITLASASDNGKIIPRGGVVFGKRLMAQS